MHAETLVAIVAIHIVCALRSPLLGVEIAIDQVIVKSVLSSHTSPSPASSQRRADTVMCYLEL